MIKTFKLNKVASALCLATSMAVTSIAVAQEASTEPTAKDSNKAIEVIEVKGYLSSLARSMAIKRESQGVVDAVSAEDIGKFPDENVAESLQRIPGVAISRERGEGKFVSVRGLGPAFTPVTLNGRTVTAGRTDLAAFTSFNPVAGRSFAFNVLPSSVVAGLNVYKSPTADLIEGGIGGLIDMQTVRPLNAKEDTLNFSAQGVYEDVAKSVDPRLAIGYTGKFADDTIGVHLSGGYSKRSILEERLWHWGWVPGIGADDLGTIGGGVDYPDAAYAWNATPSALEGDFERSSVVGVFQYQPNDSLTATVDVLYSDYTSEVTEIQMSHRAENGSFTGIFPDPNPGGHAFPFKMHDINVDPKNGRITRWSSYDPSGQADPEPVTITSRQEKNTLNSETFAIGGNIDWQADNWSLSSDIAYSKAESDWDMKMAGYEADFFVTWSFEDPSVRMPSMDISLDPNDPTGDPSLLTDADNWFYRGTILRLNQVEDEEVSLKIDFDYEFESEVFTTFEAGIRYADRTKTSVRRASEPFSEAIMAALGGAMGLPLDPRNGLLNVGQAGLPTGNMIGGNYDLVPTENSAWVVPDVDGLFSQFEGQTAPGIDGVPVAQGNALAIQPFAGFNVAEKSLAIYLKQNFEIDSDMPISGNFGVRWVKTDNTTSGQSPTTDIIYENNIQISDGNPGVVSVDSSYTEVLPSAMAKMDISDELVIRASFGKSLTRPDLDKIGPNISVEASNPPTGSAGNPDLKPFTAWNYDLSLEWYFDDAAYLSAGLFLKDIDGFVQNVTETNVVKFGQQFSTFTKPDNVGSVKIKGIELAYQQSFSMLPEPFNGLGVQLNYTRIDSDTSYDEGFELSPVLEAVGFQGLSEDNYNAVVFYEKGDFSGRVSYNYRSEYFTGFNIFSPRVQDGYGQVDATISYALTDSMELTFEAVNLTKNEFTHYDGGDKDFVSEITRTGTKFFLGVRGSFEL